MPLTHPEEDNCGADASNCPAQPVHLDDASVSNLRRMFELLDAWNREASELTPEKKPSGTSAKQDEEHAA